MAGVGGAQSLALQDVVEGGLSPLGIVRGEVAALVLHLNAPLSDVLMSTLSLARHGQIVGQAFDLAMELAKA